MTDPDSPQWQALAQALSETAASGSGVRILQVAKLAGGWETDVYEIEVERRHAGATANQHLVARVYPGEDLASKAELEFHVMEEVRHRGIPVPRMERLWSPSSPLGGPCILMERIAGSTLTQALRSAPSAVARTAPGRMADLLAKIHGLKPAQVFSDANSFLAGAARDHAQPSLLAELQQLVHQHNLSEFESELSRLARDFGRIGAGERRLLHNDFHPGNILVRRPTGEWIVIDWSFAAVGDPRLDLAWSALLVGTTLGEPARQAFLDRYRAVAEADMEDFEAFERLKLTHRLATLASWLLGLVPIPIPRITVEAMRGDYRVHVRNVYERFQRIAGSRLPTFESF